MRRKLFTVWPRLVVLLLLAVGLPAHAVTSCAAGSPNTTTVIESTPTSDFNLNGNGTVTHTRTGLMWKQCAEGLSGAACATGSAPAMTWANALKAANTANTAVFAGFADWSLPNRKELESIVEYCGSGPAINRTVFPATPASNFWSGSSFVPSPTFAWNVYFGDGLTNAYNKTNSNFVRLVRGGQSLGSFDLLDPGSPGCTLDTDGNGVIDALTDGLILIRAMFGLTGTSVTNSAVGLGASRTTWAQIQPYLNGNCGANFAP